MPGLQDDNRIRNGADLIRLRNSEESCNPIAEVGVRLGIWPVEGVRGGAGPGGALSLYVREAAQSQSCLNPCEGQGIPGEQFQGQCLPCAVGLPGGYKSCSGSKQQVREGKAGKDLGPEVGTAA